MFAMNNPFWKWFFDMTVRDSCRLMQIDSPYSRIKSKSCGDEELQRRKPPNQVFFRVLKKTSVSLASVGKAFREIRYSSYLGISRADEW